MIPDRPWSTVVTSLRLAFLTAAMTAASFAVPATASAADAEPVACRNVDIPVSLSPGLPADQHLFGRLCAPRGASPQTVEVLVPGITYDHHYWDFPDPRGGTSRYSYVNAANQRGFATLAVDRLGTGGSSHPPSPAVNIYSNAYTTHQAIQAIRQQRLTSENGSPFRNVVYVGHSYGAWTGWYESDYHDADAYVFTGATRAINLPKSGTSLIANLSPVTIDPAFQPLRYDPGYMTSQPGKRYDMFYAPAPADPAVINYDETHKSTTTGLFELGTVATTSAHQLDVRVPTLLVDGEQDSLFCRAELGGADCSSPESLLRDERGHLGPRVPRVDAITVPDTGHDLNTSLHAQQYFSGVQNWVSARFGAPSTRGITTPPPQQPPRTPTNPLGPLGDTLSGATTALKPLDQALAPLGNAPGIHDLGGTLNPLTGRLL